MSADSDRRIIAECIASTGYGTDWYDSEANECHHQAYAGVETVISNPEYWAKYEGYMSETLWRDFGLPWGFDDFHLFVWSDGTTSFREKT